MAIEDMAEAKPGETISSREHNKVTANVADLDARLATVETGAIRFRAVRTTGGALKINETQPVFWLDGADYAKGISLRNNTDLHLSTPGLYLFTATLCLTGTISSGNRLQVWFSPTGDTTSRYGQGQHPLPARYPLATATALVLATDPMDISVYTWTDTTAKPELYTSNDYCAVSGTYLGGVT